MAPRKPAGTFEIGALLIEFIAGDGYGNLRAVRYSAFTDYVMARVHTTRDRARLWIRDAATDESAPFQMIYGQSTTPSFVLARSDEYAKWHDEQWRSNRAFTWETGPFDDLGTTVRFDINGLPAKSASEAHAGDEYLITGEALAWIIVQAKGQATKEAAERRAKRLAEIEAAEAEHGDAINLLRGLLRTAEVRYGHATMSEFRITHNEKFRDLGPDMDASTMVHLTLTGAALEKLAVLLREKDIEPRPRWVRTTEDKPANA